MCIIGANVIYRTFFRIKLLLNYNNKIYKVLKLLLHLVGLLGCVTTDYIVHNVVETTSLYSVCRILMRR